MLDFDVQRFTRHCHATGRELTPGEPFYSVLVAQGAQVVRRDYAADAWPGLPETPRPSGTGSLEIRPESQTPSHSLEPTESPERLESSQTSESPEKVIAWWKSLVPGASSKKMQLAPSEVMLQYFQELEGRPDKEDERYVLALLLTRRRILRQERVEQDPLGRELVVLYCARSETEYRTPVVMPSPERAVAIQEELGRLLKWE